MNINLFFRRLKSVPVWLWEASVLWKFVSGIVVVCISVDWVGCWSGLDRIERLPYSGWILELLGLTVVALGLAKKWDLFDQASLVSRALKWFRRFPLLRQDQVVKLGTARASIGKITSSAYGKVGLREGATAEETVDFLMRQFENFGDRIHDLQLQTKTDIEDVRVEAKKISSDIREEIEAIQSQSVKAHVGDIGLEVMGLGWILIGITLATVPELVLRLFGGMIASLQVWHCITPT